MSAQPEYYGSLLEETHFDTESITIVVASGADRTVVAEALGLDLAAPLEESEVMELDESEFSSYTIVDVPGGAFAFEVTGYADPSLDMLARLSAGGRSAAVVRSNIQGRVRFGCARDGAVVFDDDEYIFIDDPEVVPEELRALFDLAWEGESAGAAKDIDPVTVGLAMAEVYTDIRITADNLDRLVDSPSYLTPALAYPD